MTPPGRALATCAVGFLLLDAVLLVWFGVQLGSRRLVGGGIACASGATAVLLIWQRYRRTLADVEAGRREMKAEAESLRQLLKQHHPQT